MKVSSGCNDILRLFSLLKRNEEEAKKNLLDPEILPQSCQKISSLGHKKQTQTGKKRLMFIRFLHLCFSFSYCRPFEIGSAWKMMPVDGDDKSFSRLVRLSTMWIASFETFSTISAEGSVRLSLWKSLVMTEESKKKKPFFSFLFLSRSKSRIQLPRLSLISYQWWKWCPQMAMTKEFLDYSAYLHTMWIASFQTFSTISAWVSFHLSSVKSLPMTEESTKKKPFLLLNHHFMA